MTSLKKLALVGGLALLAIPALAGEARLKTLATEIGLTPDQQDKIEAIHYDYAKDRIDAKAQAQKAKLELKQVFSAETLDEKAAYRAFDELQKAQDVLAREKMEQLVEMRKVMTAEQWEKASMLREERKGERRAAMRDGIEEWREGEE